MTYPIEAEQPIVSELALREGWLNVTPTAIATTVLTALTEAGWRLVYPDDFPGLCQRCKNPIEEGTVHRMFNGNQMFACAIERVETF